MTYPHPDLRHLDLRHHDLPDDQELVPVGGGAGREFPAFHLPGLCNALGGGEDLALAVAGVQGVHGLVELRGTGGLGGGEEIALTGRTGVFQPEEHDAGLAVSRSGDEKHPDLLADGAEHVVRRVCRLGERHRAGDVGMLASRPHLRVDVAPGGGESVLAELRGGLCGECVGIECRVA